ncbi:response regulator transcription factor [Helicobacter sp. MIT 14-3879]|uniref:response regulator transcription factor n=1 Tax=Helicobacter sp. MIT 14-3879 TaxID=2040649 RepID=UPI000E1E86F9|nr:response regulator transcription factor [Helicobacter sp. MIT 14-3879]RDU63980.1 DNA-binding response regulator [Helicobacter sp. MIT 14-3879]
MIEIIMIEDDEELAEILTEFLGKNDICVTNYRDPLLGIKELEKKHFDLMLLDLTLPNIDGLEVCKKVTAYNNIPIIISSARSDTQDKVDALEYGADDYLPKPYDPKELLARINSVLRRYSIIPTQVGSNKSIFMVDKDSMSIYFKNNKLDLTRAEYEILTLFLSKPNFIFSRENIADKCQSITSKGDYKSIDVMIGRLRNKICEDSKNPKYILSVRGRGYKVNL